MSVLIVSVCMFAQMDDARLWDLFAIREDANIMEQEHLGIANGKLTCGVNYKDVTAISGLWAPPYVSSDFSLEARVAGEAVSTKTYAWRPFSMERAGAGKGFAASSVTSLIHGRRAGVLALTLENTSDGAKDLSVELRVQGTLDRTDEWGFPRPASSTPAPGKLAGKQLVKDQGDHAIVLRVELEGLEWNEAGGVGRAVVSLKPQERRAVHVAFAIGAKQEAMDACDAVMGDPERSLADAREDYLNEVRNIFKALPTLDSDNAALMKFYYRSLVPLLMNRWDVPEFVLHPNYTTGSVKGGCVCNYLWDFGEPWELLPLFDAPAVREHIKQFLKTDITTHFAFNPITGEAFGPWYPVNQEKIIGLIFYYVKNTGDVAFLSQSINGKTILEWAVANAMFGDDVNKPIEMIDYGPSNSHLELRRGFPYNHVMPDLNGRRYANYLMAYRLCEIAGQPALYLKERAELLKAAFKEKLWNARTRWFDFANEKGEKDTRFTIQMFKLFASGVLDSEEEAGLLSHINETEFLSGQGLHSMSKTDIAYDQVDIDNGGGGSYTSFPPQIAERLYKCGHSKEADDILRRSLWWGERMPYWGDSLVANAIDYRKDTPLQCTIGGLAVAQCVVFGLFGVNAEFDGDIVINPHVPAFASRISLAGLRLRGRVIDTKVDGAEYEVRSGAETLRAKVGEPVLLKKS